MMMMLIQLRMIDILLLMIDDAAIDTKFDNFAKRDGATERRIERRSDGRSDGRSDEATGRQTAYWDAMNASKNRNLPNADVADTQSYYRTISWQR